MTPINLYLDFEFTSLSPDAQPISIGVVSDDDKSIYCEFSDFDIDRCDDWVKDNVVGKLQFYGTPQQDKMFLDSSVDEGTYWGSQNTTEIAEALYRWLKQFSDYQIQFVVDCGTWDWYHLLKLIGEWEEIPSMLIIKADAVKDVDVEEIIKAWKSGTNVILKSPLAHEIKTISSYHIGLPKLPSNISPVPFDLNDLIAIKKGISPKEAFDLSRSWLFNNELSVYDDQQCVIGHKMVEYDNNVHNSLFDAKVIKSIHNKLK